MPEIVLRTQHVHGSFELSKGALWQVELGETGPQAKERVGAKAGAGGRGELQESRGREPQDTGLDGGARRVKAA